MKNRLRSTGLSLCLCLLVGAVELFDPAGRSLAAGTDESGPSPGEMSMIRMQNYASLPGLVAMVGRDAISQFQDFFDVAPVSIEPFVVLNVFSTRKRISLLGATLADQVAAAVGNEALAIPRPRSYGDGRQQIFGLLQEIDGYLRIHITGVNTRGERRSYLVSVEMSEPLYRALHSYVYLP